MGPAIALRLRQHLTLTPQVQQALRLLQMSALEFAQEMEQALAQNPFLEEKEAASETAPDAAAAGDGPANDAAADASAAENTVSESPIESQAPEAAPSLDDFATAPESSGAAPEREQEDWSANADATPTLQQHLREQLMISPMGERDR